MLDFCGLRGLLGQRQALAYLGQLHGLGLLCLLHVGQALFQCNGCALCIVQLALQVVHRLQSVGHLALGLLPLLARRADDLGHATLSSLYRLVVQLDGQRCKALG